MLAEIEIQKKARIITPPTPYFSFTEVKTFMRILLEITKGNLCNYRREVEVWALHLLLHQLSWVDDKARSF